MGDSADARDRTHRLQAIVNRVVKAVVAVLFVAGLGVALAIPIIRSSDSAPASDRRREPRPRRTREARPRPSPTPTPPAPTPAPEPSPTETVAANRFATPYPDHCLDAVEPPTGTGLVAAHDGRRVAIQPADGGETTTFRAPAPIAWAPTGDVLATGDGDLYTADGERNGHLFAREAGRWAWSPIANCAIQASDFGIVASSIHGPDKLLTSIPSANFSISPDGTRLAFVHPDDDGTVSLLFANLRKGTLREVLPGGEISTIAFHGWAPDGVTVLYSVAEDDSVDGAPLLGVSQGEGPQAFSGEEDVLRDGDAITRCGSQLLGAVGSGEGVKRNNRLSLLTAGEPPDYLSATGFAYGSPSCSADGAFAVATRAQRADDGGAKERRLILLQVDDGSESSLISGDYTDEHAQWADTATAVLLVRRPLRRGPPEVWILEGSSARSTGLTLSQAAYPGSSFWPAFLDWTATAPSGTAK